MAQQGILPRIGKLLAGLAITAVGIVLTVQANIGTEPWSVLHQGISQVAHISFGNASVVVGMIAIVLSLLLGEQIGIGTLANILLTGKMLDGILATRLIPRQHSFWPGLVMLLAGLELITLGTWLYMSSQLGSGPRDALNVGLARLTRRTTGFCRSCMELLAIGIGWATGGQFGVGTVISAVGIGVLFQLNFRLLHFEPTALRQENLKDTLERLAQRTHRGS